MHAYPQWEPPEDDPTAAPEDYREVWRGAMRLVGRQRARTLRRRGVPLMSVHRRGGVRAWAWFIELRE